MLDVIGDGFKQAKQLFQGQTTLTEDKIEEAVALIRASLLDADVEYGVAKNFIAKVKAEALGRTVELKAGRGRDKARVTPTDHFVNICKDQLVALMGPVDSSLSFAKNRPTVIMMVGLQGSGKTTTSGKLTRYLKESHNKTPLLVAADVYRPAAREQLKTLAAKLDAPVHFGIGDDPVEICRTAIAEAFDKKCDTVIIDTAGRLAIDDSLMDELDRIKATVKPDNILFVCDSMMGQDAVDTAKEFVRRLDFSGVIMTKLDGDARGGAALSIKEVTGKPIKFLGIGESLERLEEFRPEGLASRILGLGDIVGLMQDFERVAKKDQEEEALKMLKGKFNFTDFYEQLSTIQKMGSLTDLVGKLPIQDMLPKDAKVDDKELVRIKAMIDSMTQEERERPQVLNTSRMQRIAKGSGRSEKDVGELVTKFRTMQKMMTQLGKGMGLLGKIPGMKGLANMKSMAQMAQSMAKGGGLGGLGGMPGLQDMFGGSGQTKKFVDRDKLKKDRKKARQARKRNRRK